jgi:hypothetical protein
MYLLICMLPEKLNQCANQPLRISNRLSQKRCESCCLLIVIDLEIVENTPSFLMSVVTLQGSDRGTKLFRIENVLRVDIDLLHPNLSRWHADAIPLSRKTGKDMSGRPGNKRSAARTTVRIAGYIDVLNKTGDRDKSIFNLLDICGNE